MDGVFQCGFGTEDVDQRNPHIGLRGTRSFEKDRQQCVVTALTRRARQRVLVGLIAIGGKAFGEIGLELCLRVRVEDLVDDLTRERVTLGVQLMPGANLGRSHRPVLTRRIVITMSAVGVGVSFPTLTDQAEIAQRQRPGVTEQQYFGVGELITAPLVGMQAGQQPQLIRAHLTRRNRIRQHRQIGEHLRCLRLTHRGSPRRVGDRLQPRGRAVVEIVEERTRSVHLDQHRCLQPVQTTDLTLDSHVGLITPVPAQATELIQIGQRLNSRSIDHSAINHGPHLPDTTRTRLQQEDRRTLSRAIGEDQQRQPYSNWRSNTTPLQKKSPPPE